MGRRHQGRRAGAVLVTLFALLGACSGDKDDKHGERERPAPITVVDLGEVTRGTVLDLLLASGTVEAEAAADLVPQATGRVVEVRVDVGDKVRKGQVLAVIDNESAQAAAERAGDNVRRLARRLEELEKLQATGAVSRTEVDEIAYQLQEARTTLREASAAAGQTRLVAPFDGVIGSRTLKVGDLAAGGAPGLSVVDPSTLRVLARLPERDLGRVAIGQPARLVSAYDPDAAAPATVARIAPVVDATTGTFEVVLTVQQAAPTLRPGQYVNVEIETDRHADVVVVPKTAIRYDDGAPFVFTVTDPPADADPSADAKAEPSEDQEASGGKGEGAKPREEPPGPRFVAVRVPLTLGLDDRTLVEVRGGIDVGAPLILAGHERLQDGALVRPPATDGTAQEPSQAATPASAEAG